MAELFHKFQVDVHPAIGNVSQNIIVLAESFWAAVSGFKVPDAVSCSSIRTLFSSNEWIQDNPHQKAF